MALQAGGIGDLDGLGNVQNAAGPATALRHQFCRVRVQAELLNDVGLPVRRAVAGVGRVQGCFLVAVVTVFLLDVVQCFRCSISWDGLRQKDFL